MNQCYACHAPKVPTGADAQLRSTCVQRGHHTPAGRVVEHEHTPTWRGQQQPLRTCTSCRYLVVTL